MIFVSLLLGLVLSVHAEISGDCGASDAYGIKYDFCIYKNPKSDDVLHYLHVNGGNVKSWENQNTNKMIRDHWTSAGKEFPNVITFSMGKAWLLTDVQKENNTSKYYAFINKILPDLENRLGGFTGRRMLMGDSMGGLNSTFIMARAGNMFERVAINCPVITPMGPHAPSAEIDAYIERHQPYISRIWVWWMLNWGKEEFPTEQDWNNHSPIDTAKASPVMPQNLYVSTGTHDQFGIIEGAKIYADVAQAKGINVVWKPIQDGKHCSVNTKAVSEFLLAN